MPYGVLPAGWRVTEVREMLEYPSVDFLDGQSLDGAVLDGHEYETGERVRGFAVFMQMRIVRYVDWVLVAVRHRQIIVAQRYLGVAHMRHADTVVQLLAIHLRRFNGAQSYGTLMHVALKLHAVVARAV